MAFLTEILIKHKITEIQRVVLKKKSLTYGIRKELLVEEVLKSLKYAIYGSLVEKIKSITIQLDEIR